MKNKKIGMLFCILLIISVLPATGFTYDGPHVEITWPPDNYETDQSTITLTGYAGGEFPINEYGYTIQYPDGGIFSEYWPINPPVEYYEFEISVTLVEGEDGNHITVSAEDLEGQQGTDEVTIIYTPGEDTEPPNVVITYPEDGQYFLNPDISLQGTVTDNVGITKFTAYNYWNEEEYEIDTEYFSDPVASYEFNLGVTLKLGINTIVVTAYDEANNVGEDTVQITHSQCTHDTPVLTDNSGATRFHGVFIGCEYRGTDDQLRGTRRDAITMFYNLNGRPGWNRDNMEYLQGDSITIFDVQYSINTVKRRARPGDEFLFFFSGHGGNRSYDSNGDEPDGYDEYIVVDDGIITDDTLASWLSDFPDCVTITVKLDCCHSGGFFDGDSDLQNATNADDEPYGPDHINIEAACAANETTRESRYVWVDDGDGIVEFGELRRPDQRAYNDANNNHRLDPGEEWYWWFDDDGDGNVDNDEIQESQNTTRIGDFTYSNLEGLANETNIFTGGTTLKADRNKDGITTTKELYEYSINYLNEAHNGDDDLDGLIDEDGPDFEENSTGINIIYIDNDEDGLIDEDPAPPSFAFWYNELPSKPSKPTGQVKGKPDEEYTYSTMSTDPEYDDIYYWFDWGDGTNTGWVGPFMSGQPCNAQHSWDEKGDYQVKVKSRDRCYAESPWSDPLTVSMPKNKAINRNFLNIFYNHPNIYKLLQYLIYLIDSTSNR